MARKGKRSWEAKDKRALLKEFEKLAYGKKTPWLAKKKLSYSHISNWRAQLKRADKKAA